MEKVRLLEVVEDFVTNVEPHLFPDGRRHAKGYTRVRDLIHAYRAVKEGRQPRYPLTYEWVKRVLQDFAPDRYEFREEITIRRP